MVLVIKSFPLSLGRTRLYSTVMLFRHPHLHSHDVRDLLAVAHLAAEELRSRPSPSFADGLRPPGVGFR